MWNHSNEGLRDYSKGSVVELHVLMISTLALHSKAYFNKNNYSLFPDYVSQTVACFFGNEISWSLCGLRDLAFEKPGKIFNLTLSKLGSCAIGKIMFWGGTVSILKE